MKMNILTSPRLLTCTASVLAGLIGTSVTQAQTTLAEFHFNEGTGTNTSSAANELVGTLGVTPNPANLPLVITEAPSGAATDRAVQMQGTGFLVVDDSDEPVLAVDAEPLTVEAWVKWDGGGLGAPRGILAYGASYKLGINSGGQIIWTLFGVVDVSSGWELPADDLWHHVAAAYEPGVGVSVYLDGVESWIEETQPMRAFGNNRFSIGSEGLSNPLAAAFDRVRVHKALLSAEQLDSVATEPKPALETTLVAYDFNETEPPFQNATATVRPAITSEAYSAAGSVPAFSSDSPTGAAGDYSMEFSVAGQRVVVPDPDQAIRLDTGDFTIQAWAKFGPQAARAVLFFNNGPGGAVSFSILDRNVFVTTLGILDQPSSAAIPDDDAWHHLAVVHDATALEFRFYVDGALGDTVSYEGGVLIDVRTATEFFIGSETTGGLPFVGKLDRLKISAGVLPVEELDYPVEVVPSAPELTIVLATDAVELTWPSNADGYVLQSTTDLANSTGWTAVSGTPVNVEGNLQLSVPTTASDTFFRLTQP